MLEKVQPGSKPLAFGEGAACEPMSQRSRELCLRLGVTGPWRCLAMQLSARIGMAVAFLVSATSVLSAEVLTKDDWRYLKSNGYTEDSYALGRAAQAACDRAANGADPVGGPHPVPRL